MYERHDRGLTSQIEYCTREIGWVVLELLGEPGSAILCKVIQFRDAMQSSLCHQLLYEFRRQTSLHAIPWDKPISFMMYYPAYFQVPR